MKANKIYSAPSIDVQPMQALSAILSESNPIIVPVDLGDPGSGLTGD